MEKKLLIVANWKANKTLTEAKDWIKKLAENENFFEQYVGRNSLAEIVVAPPHSLLWQVGDEYELSPLGTALTLGAQDISMYPSGAYTGEVTREMLLDAGVNYVLVGHSERRKYLGETNTNVEKKMEQAINCGITPIVCAQTLEEIPSNIRNYPPEKYVIMYEPMEAISTDGQYHAESPERVEAVLEEWKGKLNLQCRLLYGGSVNPDNVGSFAALPLVSGFVVGHASLDPEAFFSIIKRCLSEEASL